MILSLGTSTPDPWIGGGTQAGSTYRGVRCRLGLMTGAESVEAWGPDCLRWSAYSPAHKVELMSHAVRGADGRYLVFDPIPLSESAWRRWPLDGLVSAIVLTNGNHERAAGAWRSRVGCPVFGPAGVPWEQEGIRVAEGRVPGGWRVVPLPGGAPGETSWRLDSSGLVVFGDAVVNLAGRGLELLPAKYCTDPAELRKSLELLTREGFERAMFAHGDPIGERACERIRALVG